MTFTDKINKILTTNTLGIKSVHQLEKHVTAGTGAILRYHKSGEHPGKKTVDKIIEGMRISRTWWDEQKGEIYTQEEQTDDILNHPLVITMKDQIRHMENVIKLQEAEIERLKAK